ncbi:MAG: stage II sporulation protein M [Eubacterium sp.]
MEDKIKEIKLPEEHKKNNIEFNFEKDKYLIYSTVFYLCGILIGSSLYKAVTSEALDNILKPKSETLINLFLSNMCLYMTLFLVVVFLGLCLIGYPIMNVIPVFLGIEYGLKISYYLINYSTKGVGYSILMIVPFSAAFVTVISYTLCISAEMSKNLMILTKEGSNRNFDIKPYLKKYAVLGAVIISVSFASAGVTILLFSVVTI